MRVAQSDTTEYGPVALAPEPEAAPDSIAAAPVAPAPAAPAAEPAPSTEQGYAPYGGGGSLELRRIGQWTRTGVGEARRLVIRDANAWAQFWAELGVGDRPAVDFSKDVVIAAAAGQRSSGGYEIMVDRVTQQNGELTAEVVETVPGPNCMTTGSLTQPVDVVVVPGVTAKGWSFVDRKDVRDCR
jgi:hypothetical protein